MRANLADFTLWEVKFKAPRENVAARELEAEDDVVGRSGMDGDLGIDTELVLWVDRWRVSRR